MASSYAAPHTPIASTKRVRVLKDQRIQSPGKIIDINHESNSRPTAKALFSPHLHSELDDEAAEVEPPAEFPALEEEESDDDEYYLNDKTEFNPYIFIGGLPAHASVTIRGKVCLPPIDSSSLHLQTLTLDLDETLVHCSVEPIPNPDLQFPVTFNGISYQVYVRKRPYLDHFLEAVSRHFEVVVFTASQEVYANKLLDLIDPGNSFVKHRLFRDSCLLVQGNYVKDLAVLGRDLSKTVLVDNSPHAYSYHLENGVPIESWFDDDSDIQLLKLITFLESLKAQSDVRPFVRDYFKSHVLVERSRQGLPVKIRPPPL